MRSLFVLFVLALLILGAVNVFAFPGSKPLIALNHAVITLILFAILSSAILLMLDRPSGRKAVAAGALTPIVCLILGNSEIYNLFGRIYHSAFNQVLQMGVDQVTALLAGTAIGSLASGMLTFVFFNALWPVPASKIGRATEPSDLLSSSVGREVE